MSKLKNCPQCGHKTTRDFCTPQCRMEDSDNRIEAVEEENARLKEELKQYTKKAKWSKDRIEGLEKSEANLDKLCFKRKIEILKYNKALEEIANAEEAKMLVPGGYVFEELVKMARRALKNG